MSCEGSNGCFQFWATASQIKLWIGKEFQYQTGGKKDQTWKITWWPDDQTVSDLGYFVGTIAKNADFCPLIYTNFKELLKDEADPKCHNDRIWKYINVWKVKFYIF